MNEQGDIASELRKIANLLALRQVADMKKGEAAFALNLSGFSNKEIAAQLTTSEDTVKGQVRNILSKLVAKDRTHAAMIGLKRGIIEF